MKSPKRAVEILQSEGVDVVPLREIVRELVDAVRKGVEKYRGEGRGHIGKEDDVLLAFIRELVLSEMIGQGSST
jgi:hemerythrin-like domain-containing protein